MVVIARIWHGMTPVEKADEYTDYLHRTGLPDYKATEGNLGAYILKRPEGNRMHFIALTFWESKEAIRRFAGDQIERARYYPEDEEFLIEKEPFVHHYEVVT